MAEFDQESEGGESAVFTLVCSLCCFNQSCPQVFILSFSKDMSLKNMWYLQTSKWISHFLCFKHILRRCHFHIISLRDQITLWLSHFPGCHVPFEPPQTVQHHSLHHRQRPAARLLQWQRPRVTQGQWGNSSSVKSHWTGGLLQRKRPEPRSAIRLCAVT